MLSLNCGVFCTYLSGKKRQLGGEAEQPLLPRLVHLPEGRLPHGLVQAEHQRLLHPGHEPARRFFCFVYLPLLFLTSAPLAPVARRPNRDHVGGGGLDPERVCRRTFEPGFDRQMLSAGGYRVMGVGHRCGLPKVTVPCSSPLLSTTLPEPRARKSSDQHMTSGLRSLGTYAYILRIQTFMHPTN